MWNVCCLRLPCLNLLFQLPRNSRASRDGDSDFCPFSSFVAVSCWGFVWGMCAHGIRQGHSSLGWQGTLSVANPPTSYRSLSGLPGLKSQKNSEKPSLGAPKSLVRVLKYPKNLKSVSKISFETFSVKRMACSYGSNQKRFWQCSSKITTRLISCLILASQLKRCREFKKKTTVQILVRVALMSCSFSNHILTW